MMRSPKDILRDLRELIEKALDGSISPEELVRLDDCIVHNPEQRRYYCEYLYMTVGLMRLCDYTPLTGVQEYDKLYLESLWNALFLEEKAAPTVVTKESTDTAEVDHPKEQNQKISTQKVNKVFLFMAVVSLTTLLFIITSARFCQMLIPRGIATLSTSLHAAFTDNQTVVSGARLTNRKAPLLLQTGLIEIVFDGGARVLLEAPTEFRLKSANRMVLYTGQLFAFVPNYAKRFTLETPNARIIDMGTEFGVRVEKDGTSDLHLFKGKAVLTSDSGSKDKRTQTLTAGQAKRVDASGRIRDIPIKEQAFVRNFHSETDFVWRGQRLCLVDIVGEGNGLGTGRTNVYVDPIQGYTESLYCSGKGNEYHPFVSNPFIDGLFIPDGSKMQIISSQTHEFADCPKTNGECYTTLGANPNQGIWATDMRNGIVQFNGQEYGDQNHPCLVMHANLGITFDLNTIRAMCPELKITHFVSKIGIADFEEHAGCNADFWVLVDGQVRQCRRNITQKNVLSNVSIELGPSDRFLTLVTTDGGDIDRMGSYQRSYTCDWCVFVEPALIIETGKGAINIRTK
jgi:hypothetical protein